MTTLSSLQEYGLSFQTKVIGVLLTDKNVLFSIGNYIQVDYFDNQAHRWIAEYTLEYFKKRNINPDIEVISIEVKKIENKIFKVSVTEALQEAYKLAEKDDIDYVKEEFKAFCRNQKMKQAIMDSVDLLALAKYDQIREIFIETSKIGEDHTDTGSEYEKDVERRYRETARNEIPWPWETFNNLTQGGIGAGDLVLIFGNPGGGKSWSVVDMAINAAKLGYNVLYYTLELGEDYVGKRIDAALTGYDVDKCKDHTDEIEEALSKLPGRIRIKEYPPRTASFDTLRSNMATLKQKEGFVPDMIIIDYLDYMKTISRKDKKAEIDDIYVDAKGFAKELQIPVVSPSQANRTGAKANIIEGDNIAGSYDKLMIGDIVISLTRNRKDKINGTGRWHIMKNRFGPDGWTFNSTINLSNGNIQIDLNPMPDDEDGDDIAGKNWKTKVTTSQGFDGDDLTYLKNKFFEINNTPEDEDEDEESPF